MPEFHNFGTLVPGSTVLQPFNTINALGAAAGYTETPAFIVYKNSDLTQLTVAGHGLSVVENFDTADTGFVGFHQMTMVLTNDFYTVDTTFTILYSDGEIDSVPLEGLIFGVFDTYNRGPQPMLNQPWTFALPMFSAKLPVAGLTPTVEVSYDGGHSYAAPDGALQSPGTSYLFDATMTDMNAAHIMWKATDPAAEPTYVTSRTRAS